MAPRAEHSTSLNAARRQRELDALRAKPKVDLVVVGGGVTGAGTALDAASRGLSVVLVEKHDLAFGTSRWSSKLVHGGLRYLLSGHASVALESAFERDVLMRRTAPHLVRSLPSLLPVLSGADRGQAALARSALLAGDALRMLAGTPASLLPRSRRVGRAEAMRLAPGLCAPAVRSGLLAWDGQLTDDARLVVALARTAAGQGARVLTRCSARHLTGRRAWLRDELSGEELEVEAGAVVNATGVWAGDLVPEIALRPSRGTHLVLRDARLLGGLRCALTLPVPGEVNRFVLVLPQADGRVYVGLTDEASDGPVPDVPQPTEPEIAFLLDVLNSALDVAVARDDVAGAFAGLRPLLDTGQGRTSGLSRKHAVLVSRSGVVTVVGGKLTTYRRMAEHAVDAAVRHGSLRAGPCRTRRLPLVGAAPRRALASVPAPEQLVARYGTEAVEVIDEADAVDVMEAELRFAVRHEGALDVDDLLHRRTRVGLVAADAHRHVDAANQALAERPPSR